MRNAIKYYYDIDVNEISSEGENYFFDGFILRNVDKKIDYGIYEFFIHNNIFIYKIVLNRFNSFETTINLKKYILLEVDVKKTINFGCLLPLYMFSNLNIKVEWTSLWKKKVDYYEKIYNKILDETLKKVFPYYIGLSEVAIKYYDENIKKDYSVCFSHERINASYEFFCPDNIIVDCKARDLSELVKYSFFHDKLNLNEFVTFMDTISLSIGDYIMLYSRLLFPTYFFDCIEFNKNCYTIYSKINQYEKLLNEIYYIIRKRCDLPPIEWLIKKI